MKKYRDYVTREDMNNYSNYIVDNINKNIDYTEYIAENLNRSIEYSEYLADKLNNNPAKDLEKKYSNTNRFDKLDPNDGSLWGWGYNCKLHNVDTISGITESYIGISGNNGVPGTAGPIGISGNSGTSGPIGISGNSGTSCWIPGVWSNEIIVNEQDNNQINEIRNEFGNGIKFAEYSSIPDGNDYITNKRRSFWRKK